MKCHCIDAADETAELFDERTVKARKNHRCRECGDEIVPGDRYIYTAGKFDGEFFTVRTCLACWEICQRFFCSWIHGEVWEDFLAAYDDLPIADIESLTPVARDKAIEMLMRRQ